MRKSTKKKKICVITGSRAEYGLLRPLMKEIKKDRDLKLQLIATGTHLSPEFGSTYKEIEKDGFKIDKKIEISLEKDTPGDILKSMGLAGVGLSKAFDTLKPDMACVLGDRFEILSAATTALINNIPIAHIHGGELSEGVIDDAFRHAITKMGHLHFTSTDEYRRRVIQLGEEPGRVFTVGALGIDSIKTLKLLSKKAVEKKLNLKFKKHNLLVTFHPATLEKNTSAEQFQNLLDTLDELSSTGIIFTKSNADPGGRVINKMIDSYVSKNPDKTSTFTSMGQELYLSTMQFVDGVVGNSSSGIIEAPSFKIGTINIGDRQRGRIAARSVIHCRPDKKNINRALKKLYSKPFQRTLKYTTNPYGEGNAARKIKNVLKTRSVKNILKKSFFDLK